MHWIFFAIASVVIYSISSLFQRLAMKEENSDPVISTMLFELILAFLGSIIALVYGFHIPDISLWPYFVTSALLYALGTLYFFRAIKIIEASEMSILSGGSAIITLIASYFLLSERLTTTQWIGAIFILVAVTVVNYQHKNFRYSHGILYALLGTAIYGIAVVSDGYVLQRFDTFSFLPIVNFLTAAVLIIRYPKKISQLGINFRKINKNLLIYSTLYIISAEAFYFPLNNGALVSQMSIIIKASIILTVILAMIFLKERTHPWKKLTGAILTTIGIVLIR